MVCQDFDGKGAWAMLQWARRHPCSRCQVSSTTDDRELTPNQDLISAHRSCLRTLTTTHGDHPRHRTRRHVQRPQSHHLPARRRRALDHQRQPWRLWLPGPAEPEPRAGRRALVRLCRWHQRPHDCTALPSPERIGGEDLTGGFQDDSDPRLFAQEIKNCAGGAVMLGLWSAKVHSLSPPHPHPH